MAQTLEEILAENKAKATGDPAPQPDPEPSPDPAPQPDPEPSPDPAPQPDQATFKLDDIVGAPEPDADEPILKRAKEDPKFKSKLVDVLKDDLPGQSAIADPDLYRLDVLKKTDPEAYALHSRNIFAKVDGMELLVKDFIKENPNFAGKEPEVEAYIKKEYGLDIEIPEELDEEDPDNTARDIKNNKAAIENAKKTLAFNQQKFDLAANKRREALKASFAAITLPGVAQDEPTFAERKEKFVAGWSDKFDQVVKEEKILKIGLRATGQDASTPFMEYNVSAKEFDQYAREAVNFAFNGKLEPTPENVDAVRSFIRTRIMLEKGDEIFHSIAEHARSLTNEQWEKEVNNPSGVDRSRKPSAQGASDKYQEFMSKLKKQ